MLNMRKNIHLPQKALRSEEVNELMGKIPSSILYVSIFLFCFFSIVFIFLGYYVIEIMNIDIVQFVLNNSKI